MRMGGTLTETRGMVGTKRDGGRGRSESSPPEMVLGNGIFDKGTAGPANMRFDGRGKVFAFPGTKSGKGERLCPNSDRRRWIVNKVFNVDFRYRREVGIVLPPPNKCSGAGLDLAEESGGLLGLSEVDGEAVEVQEGLLKSVDVVLVVNVRVQRGCPLQRGGRRPGRRKVDQGEGNAVDV